MHCLTYVVSSNIFMANGALNQGRESSPNECRSWPAAAWSHAARVSASPVTGVRFVRAPSISLLERSLPARSSRRNSRSHSIGHLETAAPDRGAASKICAKQRSHHRSDRNRRLKCVSADAKEEWLSRIERAAIFKLMFPIRLLESKLAQAYEILVPCRERSVGAPVKEFEYENGGDLCEGFLRATARGEHDCEPDGVADRVAKNHDLEVTNEWVFEDEGYSGATLERPGLERVRDLAAEGHIQVILAYAPDRLSRKYAYQILLIEELARHGVETLFVKAPQGDSAEDHLLVQFQGMIAEYERAQILERSRRGKRHQAHSGEISVLSGAPYGYRYIRKTDEALAAYSVYEPEARVVQRIYEMYTVQGFSIGEITRRLNAESIPTRKLSARWERSTVWAVLRNPAYRGVACFGKTRVSTRSRVMRPQ